MFANHCIFFIFVPQLSTAENLYYCKHGVRDCSAAAQHFHAAADLGWSQAFYYLGVLSMKQLGVERCDVTCKNFFRMGLTPIIRQRSGSLQPIMTKA